MTARVGIIGGGQLAQMTAQAAISLALDVTVLAETGGEPSSRAGVETLIGRADDLDSLRRLAKRCDVVTLDHEQVDPRHLAQLADEGHVIRPDSSVLCYSDKAHQRRQLAAAGLPIPAFAIATTTEQVDSFVAAHGPRIMAKAATGGYDGYGVFEISSGSELPADAQPSADRPLVLEPRLELERELSVLIARNPSGGWETYPVVHTLQRDGICHETIAPAPIDDDQADRAQQLATTIADTIGAVGILAVELFVVDGDLLVNELAPRPHNSGHWTIEGAATSQFENHLRGVLDLPIGETTARAPAIATVNVLGPPDGSDPRDRLADALGVPEVHLHLYGKAPRPGRKLGHATATASDAATALERARTAVDRLTGAQR